MVKDNKLQSIDKAVLEVNPQTDSCYNLYAVCASSAHHSSIQCGINYEEFPKETVRKYNLLARE